MPLIFLHAVAVCDSRSCPLIRQRELADALSRKRDGDIERVVATLEEEATSGRLAAERDAETRIAAQLREHKDELKQVSDERWFVWWVV